MGVRRILYDVGVGSVGFSIRGRPVHEGFWGLGLGRNQRQPPQGSYESFWGT